MLKIKHYRKSKILNKLEGGEYKKIKSCLYLMKKGVDEMENKYSMWQKIDLHIHTDWSTKTKDNDYKGSFSVQVLHEKLIEQKVKIFSLTDHNIINLPVYKEYFDTYKSDSDPLLLLGIELDIERLNKIYHSLLIFNCTSYDYAEKINGRLEDKFNMKGLDLKQRKLTLDEIIETFPEDDFFFIPHAGNTASIVDGYKGEIEEAQKMLILFQSPLEKVPEKSRQIYNHNFDKVIYDAFRNKNDYAYIEFSDNHNIQKYPCTHKGDKGDHEFYFIKGSKNYETLRLAFIDPKSRIKSSSEFSNISQVRNYINSLTIQSSTCITDATLSFSPHLNVIIGGRSSGKSLLLDILNKSINLYKSSKYDSIERDLDINIKSEFDDSYKKVTSIDTSIIQINQGDIVNYFENNKLEDLARKTGKLEEYTKAKESFGIKKTELEGLINEMHKAYTKAFELGIPQNRIIHNQTMEKYLSDEFLFIASIDELKKTYSQNDKAFLENQEFISSLIDNIEKIKRSTVVSFSEDDSQIILAFENLMNRKKKEIDEIILVNSCINLFLEKVALNIQTANSTLTTEGQAKAQAQEALKNKIRDLEILFKTLNDLKLVTDKIEAYDFTHKEEILLDSDCKLCLEIQSNESIKSLIIEGLKEPQSQNLYTSLLKLLYGDCSVKNYGNNTPDSLRKKINTQLADLLSRYDNPTDYLEYSDGTTSKSNSPGYNSEKYLQVILNNPLSNLILIDQPEDNLGNRFISEELVDLFRNLKFKKQLFLVTHNPAIVVYGDAESIILAQNNNNRISYTQIRLEDESSQKEICGVLDGGEYIFDNRARKYNIQRLLGKGE